MTEMIYYAALQVIKNHFLVHFGRGRSCE